MDKLKRTKSRLQREILTMLKMNSIYKVMIICDTYDSVKYFDFYKKSILDEKDIDFIARCIVNPCHLVIFTTRFYNMRFRKWWTK